ncbi:MAG: NAD(P)H-quinone oxidoreductase [Candidatus Dormibacteraeota bacterium]|nr:NAD(P)H-quinone oxidoreductase [Candidatus Dormibacteraeota bacterium]MBV9526347.1 NAD(P)H-quinone oxidoreductase [Candidatus Dormibacteraeota bacterium]
MKAIVVERAGGPEAMRVEDVPDPQTGPGDVLIRVAGAGVNRADVLQRMGFYPPPPPGAPDVLGLEVSGEVVAAGADVRGWRTGDRVMALIEGGGYAELARAPAAQVMAAPANVDLVTAAGIPEVFITAHDGLFTRARLSAGETVLIHGGAGGVGTAVVQLAKRAGAQTIVTAGSAEKLQRCAGLGADWGIDYRNEDFAARTLELTAGRGADVILDLMGAAYLERNMSALARDGRLVIIGLQGGVSAEIDLRTLSAKRISVIGTQLRARPAEQKAAIVSAFTGDALPGFDDGALSPVIHRVLPLAEAVEAHRLLESGEVIGKVVLRVQPGESAR